jgi:hypothetical protein
MINSFTCMREPENALPLHTVTFAHGGPETNVLATQERAATSSSMTNGQCGTPHPSHETHNARSRSLNPASSQVSTATIRAVSPQQVSPAKAAAPARTFFDPWNSSSTGHQRAENRLSGSTSWRASRNLKLSEQYKGGLGGGGKRVADTVGAGSTDFGKDGRKENGGWEKGARGLRTGGQMSLAEVWGASKAGKKSLQEKGIEKANVLVEAHAASRDTSEGSDQSEGTSVIGVNDAVEYSHIS